MATPSSGAISLNDMHVEVGGSSGSTVSINDSDIRALTAKAQVLQLLGTTTITKQKIGVFQ